MLLMSSKIKKDYNAKNCLNCTAIVWIVQLAMENFSQHCMSISQVYSEKEIFKKWCCFLSLYFDSTNMQCKILKYLKKYMWWISY